MTFVCCMMPSAVIASKAAFNSAGTELLAALEFVFVLVGVVVQASAKQSTAAHETTAWMRFFIWVAPRFFVVLDRISMPETRGQSQTGFGVEASARSDFGRREESDDELDVGPAFCRRTA